MQMIRRIETEPRQRATVVLMVSVLIAGTAVVLVQSAVVVVDHMVHTLNRKHVRCFMTVEQFNTGAHDQHLVRSGSMQCCPLQ